eukprot:s2588_g9.t1
MQSVLGRIQNEAEQLRMKNSTLATFLASAERSAMQLRSALTEAGINISDSPTSQAGVRRGESRDLKEENFFEKSCCKMAGKELDSWAARLRGDVRGRLESLFEGFPAAAVAEAFSKNTKDVDAMRSYQGSERPVEC